MEKTLSVLNNHFSSILEIWSLIPAVITGFLLNRVENPLRQQFDAMAGTERRNVIATNVGEKSSNEETTPVRRQSGRRVSSSRHDASNAFNPTLIFAQIMAIQCFHYLLLALLLQVNRFLFNTSITIDRIFTDEYLSVWTWKGWIDSYAILVSYLFGSMLLAIIVEKSKKCLDFSVTLFLIHLFSCVFYGGMPKRLDWWIVHLAGTIVMILLGEYLCSLKELSDIPLLEI